MEQFTEVFTWGQDSKGQLGLGSKNPGKCYSTPKFCSYNIMIKEISCGEEHSGFISDSGHVYCMGSNAYGKLGIDDKTISYTSSPCLVESLSSFSSIKISCGWNHTAIITSQLELFTWGSGQYGALGNGNYETQWSPLEISKNISEVSCGSRHMGVISEGKVLMCGSGEAGQLGTGKRQKECSLVPISIENIIQVSCGEFHTGLVNKFGELFMMGGNSFGQLGVGHKKSSSIPIKVDINNVGKVYCGSHSACVTNDKFFVWGNSVFGEFASPKEIRISQNGIKDVAIGGTFGLAIDSQDKVFVWGNNGNGELAQGDFQARSSAVQVLALKGKKVDKIAAGVSFCICLGKKAVKNDRKHTRTQSMGITPLDHKPETYENHNLLEIIHEEKLKSSKLIQEYDDLHRIHVELKETMQAKIQDSNFQYQQISSESFKIKDSLNEALTQIQSLKSEISYLKDENTRMKKYQEAAIEKNKLETMMNKIKETHFIEIQELQGLLDKEKVLKKQVERDFEVASTHRYRMEQALSEAHENFEKQYLDKVNKFEYKIAEILEEKEKLKEMYEKSDSKCKRLEEDLEIMHEENEFYCENTREMHFQQEKLQTLVKNLQTTNNALSNEISHKNAEIEAFDNETRALKMQIVELEKRNQEILAERDRELANRAKIFKDKTNCILTPKTVGLKCTYGQENNEENIKSPRHSVGNGQKSPLIGGLRLGGTNVFKSCFNDDEELGAENTYVEDFGIGMNNDHFTFRKTVTPSKDDVKAKIAALMQNRHRIEKKLRGLELMQNRHRIEKKLRGLEVEKDCK
ncbi:hypothetical protein SteCoe_35075 [Stentor coeruleus]|uniref:RCC1-like domain-containing protein n=1 Tax=Stentor coeruleus TaxID=5963 RepID=A0A1R2AT57_9CILI|nr:hypothetical protein SteCoe_35075 [Stentor coeruleus]